MADETTTIGSRQQFVWVKDKSGNEYACPVNVLKKPEDMSDDEKNACVDDASVLQPYAGG